uniref:Proxanthoxycyclin-B n=1 Tax=Melicope xanthoxyloides TaxID=1312821 RepID=A0A7H9SKG3_9ROSI|nr:proxanthoxycyclin-B [Melicope xanthoxyloides]
MEFSFAGENELSEGFAILFFSFNQIDEVADDNLNLIVVPQYGRNYDESG